MHSQGERVGARRIVELTVLASVAAVAIATLLAVYDFSQSRFFTIDEYQYGHATWLVSQGERPYVDFYEHHFPLSYVIHAPLVTGSESFTVKALRLRKIVFAWILAAALIVGLATWLGGRNPYEAIWISCLPPAFGFTLMTLVDYRADVFAAMAMVGCLALLDGNRRLRSRAVSAGAGLLFSVALLMTQKMIVQGGIAIAALVVADRLRAWAASRRGSARENGEASALLVHPWSFVGWGSAVIAIFLGVLLWQGMLSEAFEITIVQALGHERIHPETSVTRYLGHFWAVTWLGTSLLLVAAAGYLVLGRGWIWVVAVVVAVTAVANVKAQYPYNYIYLTYLLMICSVKGFALAVEKIRARQSPAPAWTAALYLAPIALLPGQLAFVADASTNEYQLRLLQKIEDFSGVDDAVIDNAGGAMFRPHGSYYFLHGPPHRVLFADYFERQLALDYRESRALFWIWDFRYKKLPLSVQRYLRRHYLRSDGDLYALGFFAPATVGFPGEQKLDVVRAGEYFIHRYETKEEQNPGTEGLTIDSNPVEGDRIHLDERVYTLRSAPNSPAFLLSPLPREFFDQPTSPTENLRYTRIFEYDAKPQEDGG